MAEKRVEFGIVKEEGIEVARQQTEDIRKIKFKPHYDCTVILVLTERI